MVNVIDVANFFIDLASYDEDNDMTNMKLNKLLYYAQGWSLVVLGKPLFHDAIEAWKHGPVVNSIYQIFKAYGNYAIPTVYGDYDESVFEDEQRDLLFDVYRQYNKYSASALRNMTHEKNTPWSKVYIPNENAVITTDDMIEYFSSQERLERFDIREATKETPIIECKRDKNGILIIPKEFADDWVY